MGAFHPRRPTRSTRFGARVAFIACAAAMAALLAPLPASAQDLHFFQIGTGPTGETRFPMGGLIANAISNPPGSRECEKGGSCGVPGMVAVAKSTGGSIANVEAIARRQLDAALVQADIAYWAYHGTGIFQGKGAVKDLRAIAMLYPETLHLVVRRDSGIKGVRDLKGKRVTFGDKESGSLVHGRFLLEAFGLKENQLKLSYLKPGPAADALAAGTLDAFLVIDAYPVPAIAELAKSAAIDLVPITGPEVAKMRGRFPYLAEGQIGAGTYQGVVAAVPTLEVGIMLVTNARQPDELIYGVTRALWHPSTRKLLVRSFTRGARMALDSGASEKLGIPLHGGASAYYFDAGTIH